MMRIIGRDAWMARLPKKTESQHRGGWVPGGAPRSPAARCSKSPGWLVWAATMLAINALLVFPAAAQDWPTYMHDHSRSGVTAEQLKLPLSAHWVYASKQPPRPAWPDLKFEHTPFPPRRLVFDRAFHTVAVGNAVYFGSSAEHKVICLDAATGKQRWSFFTDGPVRLAPTVHDGKVYAGCDDGYVYCLDAATGRLVWRYKPFPGDRQVIGNGKMISAWPVRTGVLVDEGIAYFCAGLFPTETEGVRVCALNAKDGSEVYNAPCAISPQGQLLASSTRLFVPCGSGTPAAFSRKDGKLLGQYARHGSGGTFALLAGDKLVTCGAAHPRDLTIFDQNDTAFKRESSRTATILVADRTIVTGKLAYLVGGQSKQLSAVDLGAYDALQKEDKDILKKLVELYGDRETWRHGTVKDWWAIGPFELGVRERGGGIPPGFDRVFPPEKEIDLRKQYDGKKGKVRWKRATADKRGELDLSRLFGHPYWGVAYALTYVHSPKDRRGVGVKTGSTFGGLKVWINDEQVFSKHEWRMSLGHDKDLFTVDLKAGWNKVLVKTEHANERWTQNFRFVDHLGLKASPTKDPSAPLLSDSDKEKVAIAQALKRLLNRREENRKQLRNCNLWKQQCLSPHSLILAGGTLFAGGDDRVDAFDAQSGKPVWTGKVDGKAYGLAVANGRLYVSTDKGEIHCFAEGAAAETASRPASRPAADASSPYPSDGLTPVYASAAELILKQTNIKRGYCLVLGCNEGRLAYEIARRTDLKIIGVEEDKAKVVAARKALDQAGFHGARVSVHHGTLSTLPYPSYFANLIVSDRMLISGETPGSADEMFRVLRPFGGVAYLGQTVEAAGRGGTLKKSDLKAWLGKSSVNAWQIVERNGLWAVVSRGNLKGAQSWTHQYADAGHSNCSNDQRVQYPLELQWFGRPGPRRMIDRHARTPAPLSTNGRLFIQGANRIIGVDAYNGTELWDTAVAGSLRVNVPSDTGNMVASADHVYITVKNECRRLDADSGKVSFTYTVPDDSDAGPRDWGYLSYTENLILGSAVKKGSFYTQAEGNYFDSSKKESTVRVTSDSLFGLDRSTGKPRWTYKGTVIINSTIAASRNRLYFVASRNPGALINRRGRILDDVFVNQVLMALDARTGKTLWQRPVDFSTCKRSIYLCHANGTLVVSGTSDQCYVYAFDAGTGKPLWNHEYVGFRGGGHGSAMRHPVIIGDVVYIEPRAFMLKTGKAAPHTPRRDGCGAMTASSTCLFYRDNTVGIWDLKTNKTHRWDPVRPGCWINMIPAAGLLLAPEGSSGCLCSFAIQTSFALAPRRKQEP